MTQHCVTLNIQGFLLTLPWLPYPWLVEGRTPTGSASGQGRPGPWESASPGAPPWLHPGPLWVWRLHPRCFTAESWHDSGLRPRLGTTVPWWPPSGVDCANDVGVCLPRGIAYPISLVLMLHQLCGVCQGAHILRTRSVPRATCLLAPGLPSLVMSSRGGSMGWKNHPNRRPVWGGGSPQNVPFACEGEVTHTHSGLPGVLDASPWVP